MNFLKAGLALGAAIGFMACDRPDPNVSARNFEGSVAEGALPVETLAIERQTFEDDFWAVGVVEPDEEVTVSAEVSGRILDFDLEVGDEVAPGGLIARLDDEALRAQIKKIEAQIARLETMIETSQKELEREQALFKSNAGSERALDHAQRTVQMEKNELAAARADLEAAQVDLRKHRIFSPVGGEVAERFVAEGEYVTVGRELVKLVVLDTVEFAFSLAEGDVTRVVRGNEIPIVIGPYESTPFTGRIKQVSPTGAPQTRTFRVWAEMENPPPHRLMPGMSGRARIVRAAYDDVFILPTSAVMREGENNFVYVSNERHARRQEVELAGIFGSRAVVQAGLTGKFDCIIFGQYALKPGDAIHVRRRHTSIPELQFD